MMGRRAAVTLAATLVTCASCEALVGITDREVGKAPDASVPGDAGHDAPPVVDAASPLDSSSSPLDAPGEATGTTEASGDAPSTYSCAKGGCNAPGGACVGAATCHCTSDSECPGSKCVSVAGENDLACGSACKGSGASDGFGCQLAACATGHFGYAPSTFTAASYTPPSMPTTDCNGTYSSTTHMFTSGGCAGQNPVVVSSAAQTTAGHTVDILVFKSLTIAAASTLSLVGGNPVVLAVYGDATIRGTVDASASGATAGAGGDTCPVTSNGVDAGTGAWETGGGGAGQAAAGGAGGTSTGNAGLGAGKAQGTGPQPLTGGCSGGLPVTGSLGFSPSLGAGGGGVQISAAGTLDFSGGTIKANGANGGDGEVGKCQALYAAQNGTGGAGGGSGGTVLLEGATVVSGTVAASGGAGGTGGAAATPNSQAGGSGGAGGAAGVAGGAGAGGTQKGTAPTGCSWGGYWSGGGGGGGSGGYLKTTKAGGACLCAADSSCATGLCSNFAHQCSGTCSGTTGAGTYDTIGCQLLTTTSP